MIPLLLLGLLCSLAQAEDSSVYTCRINNEENNFTSVRMKKYYDFVENREVGKVDLIQNFIVVESTLTKVFQIPLLDNANYIQIWQSPNLRVDAQLSYTQGSQEFHATYSKQTEKMSLLCIELRN